MKVLHVLEAVEGGTARHVVDVVSHVHAVEHAVALPRERVDWNTDLTAIDRLRAAGATVTLVEMRRQPLSPHNARAFVELHRSIRSMRPTVVHGHSSIGGALARLSAWPTRIPCVYTPNGLGTSHAILRAERLLARRTDRFVAVSKSEADLALEHRLTDPDHLAIIPNGIDLESTPTDIDLRSLTGASDQSRLVVCVARLVPQKAPETFVRAAAATAAQIGDVHFVLVGSGPLRNAIEHEAASRPSLAGRWSLIPSIPDIAPALGQAAIVALPSRFEGGPYVPLEAMRAGAAVVVTDAVGNRDTVRDGETGLVVPVDDEVALASAFTSLLTDEGLRVRLLREARRRLPEFDVRLMGERLQSLYLEVAEGARGDG
jgi:glycosyltransferase involved in cell wall biosynthesis